MSNLCTYIVIILSLKINEFIFVKWKKIEDEYIFVITNTLLVIYMHILLIVFKKHAILIT
jgi:hypothetical protein